MNLDESYENAVRLLAESSTEDFACDELLWIVQWSTAHAPNWVPANLDSPYNEYAGYIVQLLKTFGDRTEAIIEQRLNAVLKLIEWRPHLSFLNTPDALLTLTTDPVAYFQCKRLYLSKLRMSSFNKRVCKNAISLLEIDEPMEVLRLRRSCALNGVPLELAATIDQPEAPRLSLRTELIEGWLRSKLIDTNETDDLLASSGGRHKMAPDIALFAASHTYDIGQLDLSRSICELLITYSTKEHSSLYAHRGHLLLGSIDVATGDIEGGVAHLQAAQELGWPEELEVTGPDLGLCSSLVKKKLDDPVGEYLNALANVWPVGTIKIQEWLTQITAGQLPDFGEFGTT